MKFLFSKYFLGFIIFIFLTLTVLFFFLQVSPMGKRLPALPPAILPLPIFREAVPTPIPTPPLTVLQVVPADKTANVLLNDPIAISFSRALSQEEKAHIRLSITPVASGSSAWSPDNSQLIFTPSSLLLQQASYSATLLFGNQMLNWTFTTGGRQSTTAPAIKQGREVQSTYDEQWAKIQQTTYQNYPWYNQLPLSTSDYFVSFDTQQNILYADLFPTDPSNTTDINRIKQEVQQALISIGVNLQKVNLQWQIH